MAYIFSAAFLLGLLSIFAYVLIVIPINIVLKLRGDWRRVTPAQGLVLGAIISFAAIIIWATINYTAFVVISVISLSPLAAIIWLGRWVSKR